MQFMPGTTLKDLDETDIETLLPYFFWYDNEFNNDKKPVNEVADSSIVYRNGKAYKKVTAGQADWAKSIF